MYISFRKVYVFYDAFKLTVLEVVGISLIRY